jgi:hypothetical protein
MCVARASMVVIKRIKMICYGVLGMLIGPTWCRWFDICEKLRWREKL